MSDIYEEKDALEIIKKNYIEYSMYTVDQRTYSNIYDGMKAVQRRCLYTAYKSTPRHLVKLTNHIGAAICYHAHSPDSIGGVIISMASKYRCAFPLYETRGNFGSRIGEEGASAARYLECMLSDTAIDIFMPFVNYADEGTPEFMVEPLALPSLLHLAFLHGMSAIGTGTPNPNVPSFNPIDLINYYVEALNSEDFSVRDNFMVKPNVGNTLVASSKKDWLNMMKNGQGTIKYQPDVVLEGNKITITKVPDGKTVEHLIKKLQVEINQDKIDVRDESDTEVKYVIEKVPRKSVDMKSIATRAVNALSVSESYKFIFSDNGKAVFCGFNYVVAKGLEYTIKCCVRKFDHDIKSTSKQLRVLELIEKMKKLKIVPKLADLSTKDAITMICDKCKEDEEIASAVMQRPISYLTREHIDEINNLRDKVSELQYYHDNPREYLKKLYKELLPKVKSVISYKTMTEFKKSK